MNKDYFYIIMVSIGCILSIGETLSCVIMQQGVVSILGWVTASWYSMVLLGIMWKSMK